MKLNKILIQLLTKKTNEKWEKFAKYYTNDSKPFINKINRDYEDTGKFPVHILKMIKGINKNKYDSAVCILRGALPYAILFEACGWKIHYVICGRRNEQIAKTMFELRFNKNVDKSLSSIKNKKILLIENNSYNGNTSRRVTLELKKYFSIRKPDLFLDYYVKSDFLMKKYGKKSFLEYNKKLQKDFGKIYVASNIKKNTKENKPLLLEYIKNLK